MASISVHTDQEIRLVFEAAEAGQRIDRALAQLLPFQRADFDVAGPKLAFYFFNSRITSSTASRMASSMSFSEDNGCEADFPFAVKDTNNTLLAASKTST